MASELLDQETGYATRYPGKRVVRRDREWGGATLNNQYVHFWETCAARGWGASETATNIIKPDMVMLRAPKPGESPDTKRTPDDDVFVVTNAHGMNGQEIDFSRKLIAVWGDSVVQGYGTGWIEGYSDLLPGYQVLNGGVGSAMVQFTALRAIELNRRLPIAYNVFLIGQNITSRPIPALKALYVWAHKLCDVLPNVVFCTQPTPFNAELTEQDLTSRLAKKGDLAYQAGFYMAQELTKNVKGLFEMIVRHNDMLRRVAAERAELHRQHVPILDLFQRMDTRGSEDFREHFVDTCHFRLESYPYVWRLLCEELAKIVD